MTVSIPTTGGVVVTHPTQQITLRDQFAMAALTGLLAANNASQFSIYEAYEIADEMLKVRKVKKNELP